jgi:adenylate cyclase class 2
MSNDNFTEIEAKFLNINKDCIRDKLVEIGATLVRPEFDQKRINFQLPQEKRSDHKWLRVRDEGDKITLSLKAILGEGISDQKEISLKIDNFDSGVKLLESIGCLKKAFTFTKRELWKLLDTEITIDTWPFFEPFIEIEGLSEKAVEKVANKLGLNFQEAVFGSVGSLYKNKYNISLDEIENEVGDIAFDNDRMRKLLISKK